MDGVESTRTNFWSSGSMCFNQNVAYLVDQEHPGLRYRHPVNENLVGHKLLQPEELASGSLIILDICSHLIKETDYLQLSEKKFVPSACKRRISAR